MIFVPPEPPTTILTLLFLSSRIAGHIEDIGLLSEQRWEQGYQTIKQNLQSFTKDCGCVWNDDLLNKSRIILVVVIIFYNYYYISYLYVYIWLHTFEIMIIFITIWYYWCQIFFFFFCILYFAFLIQFWSFELVKNEMLKYYYYILTSHSWLIQTSSKDQNYYCCFFIFICIHSIIYIKILIV